MFPFWVNNKLTWQICSNLIIKTSEPRKKSRSGVFTVNFESIQQSDLVFLLLLFDMYLSVPSRHYLLKVDNGNTLKYFTHCWGIYIANFKQADAG